MLIFLEKWGGGKLCQLEEGRGVSADSLKMLMLRAEARIKPKKGEN